MEAAAIQGGARIPATDWLEQAPAFLAGSSAATAMVSIAASQILLGLAIVAIFIRSMVTRTPLRWPRITAPLALFAVWTVLSLAASGHVREGWPQIRKLYVYLTVFVLYSAVRNLRQVRWIAFGSIAGATLSAAWGLEQFARKYAAAKAVHQDFYTAYVGSRITGFMGHWMTFSGEMMIALLLAGSLLLFAFSQERRAVAALLVAAVLIGCGLVAAETRSMWGGAAAGGLYLLWSRKRWLVALIPMLLAVLYIGNAFGLRERMASIVAPRGDVDSNAHRALLRRVGRQMIQAHPLLGVGPEQVARQFDAYLPADVPRPIPSSYYIGHLHNIYYHYAAERGLPALAALLWMLGLALYDFLAGLRRMPAGAPARWFLHAAVAVIFAVMLAGFFELNLGDSEVLAGFLATLGCGYVVLADAASTAS
jgi:putative inorganic carbon (HCO3(-)) transporter